MITKEQFHLNRLESKTIEKFEKLWTNIESIKIPSKRHHILQALLARNKYRPKPSTIKNILDQLLHVLYSFILFGAFSLGMLNSSLSSYLFAALGGFLLGLIREVEQFFSQDLRILMVKDRLLDITMFTIGSVALMFLLRMIS